MHLCKTMLGKAFCAWLCFFLNKRMFLKVFDIFFLLTILFFSFFVGNFLIYILSLLLGIVELNLTKRPFNSKVTSCKMSESWLRYVSSLSCCNVAIVIFYDCFTGFLVGFFGNSLIFVDGMLSHGCKLPYKRHYRKQLWLSCYWLMRTGKRRKDEFNSSQ